MGQTLHRAVQRAILPAFLAAAPLSCAHDYTGPAPPVAEVDVAGLSFTEGVDTASVTLRNTGGSPLHWRITNPVAWLSAPDSGTVPPASAVQLLLHADAAPVAAGDHSGSFTVRANHFGPPITIQVQLHVPVAPAAALAGGDTLLEHPLDMGQVLIRNSGKGDLNWTARSTATWLRIEQGLSGVTASRATSGISFRIDRDSTPRDTTAQIVVESNDVDSPFLVTVRVRGIPPPQYMALPGPAADALGGFTGLQVLTGSTLSVISPLEGTVTAIPLPRAGISLAQMLERTVVAHDSGFSIVDVSTQTVERFVPVDFEVQAMAAVDGFVFLVPKSASRAHVVSIVYNDPDRRRESIIDQPPLHDLVAAGSYVYGGYDGGILRYDTWDPVTHAPVLTGNWTGIPFAPNRVEMWLRDARLITSSGAVVNIGSGAVIGTFTLPGGAPMPPLRHARNDWDVWRIVHERQSQPPSEHVWDVHPWDMHPTAIVLPDVEVAGQMVPAAAHFFLGYELRSRLIIQQAVTPDGQGPWSLLRLYY